MTNEKLCSMVDHTLLKQTATWEDIKKLCDEGMQWHTASVCIPPCYVKRAADYVQGKLTICTVVGFPNGNMTPAAKEFETREAIANGAREIDMVINIGELKAAMCHIVTETGADFIKTSTGFSTAGATFDDIALFAKNVGPKVRIKASGGISTLEDAEKFVELGATRLGTSRIIKLLQAQQK